MVLAVVPLEVLYLRRMRGKVEQGAREVRERSTDVGAFVIETLPATKFIQAVGAEHRELTRLRALGERHLSSLLRFQITEYATSAVPGLMTALARAAAFVVGGYQVIQGEWQLGALIAFSAYLAMVAGPVQSLLGLYVAVQRIAVNFDRVLELRRVRPAVSSPADPVPLPATVRGEIVLDAVVFAHPERRERVLDGVSACFPAGRKIALVGPSGAGKSTLIDLVMRYQDPLGGRILLDGIPLPQLALPELRRCIAVVSQEIVLFRGSLRDNLRYANPAASDAEIARAVEDAQLGDFIASLPQGLDTELGERATQVSGGQKQRIAIARALLQDPSILLLDEATSAVDQDTEARVVAAIDRLFGDRTRIIVSHRPGSLVNADAVFVLHNGQLRPQTDQESEHE
jgi:ATP-binding cassette subfamily B protein